MARRESVWKDPERLMKYREPAFIMSAAAGHFARKELGQAGVMRSVSFMTDTSAYMNGLQVLAGLLSPSLSHLETITPASTTIQTTPAAGDPLSGILGTGISGKGTKKEQEEDKKFITTLRRIFGGSA